MVRLAGCLILLTTAVFSVFVSWVDLTFPDDPDAILEIWPTNSAALTRKIETLSPADRMSVESFNDKIERLHKSDPSSEVPLVLSAELSEESGDKDRAVALYRAALKRQPRNISALTSWATSSIEDGQFEEAINAFESLWRVNPESETLYVESLMSLAAMEDAQIAFEKSLAEGSQLSFKALRRLDWTTTDLNLLLSYHSYQPKKAGPLIRHVFETQGPELAFASWLALLPSSKAREFKWPYDPTFIEVDAPPPFAWSITKNAELQRGGGLYISHAGRGKNRIRFASQTMLLEPGLYELEVSVDGKVSRDGSSIEWTVSCSATEEIIGRLPIEVLEQSISQIGAYIDVPHENCPAQEISLFGLRGHYPIRSHAFVRNVTISRVER